MSVQKKNEININRAIATIREACDNVREGLPEEIFLMISAMMPVPNVDLLVTDENDRILLSWRDDPYFGVGWHIPGGCIRYGETMVQRVQKTALKELGCEVVINSEPLVVRDVICGDRDKIENTDERGHHIAALFQVKLPAGYHINNTGRGEHEPGFLKWFSKLPENLLSVHDVYSDILSKWK